MKLKWALVGGLIGAIAGFVIGGSMGIAANGTATNGALPVAAVFGIIGFLIGSHIDRR